MNPQNFPKLYRKRFIPEELTLLDRDRIITANDDIIVTEWQSIKPRKDFSRGCSVYYLKQGFKVSEFIKENGELLYYYCDIIEPVFNRVENSVVVCDLLADVVIEPDGRVKVLDIGEIAEALDTGILDSALAKLALRRLDCLLDIVYNGRFAEYCAPLAHVGGRNEGFGF